MTEKTFMKYDRIPTWQKRLKTFFLVLVWVCLGLTLEITGPTLIDLKIRSGADYEEVAVAVSGRSAGYFIGSAIGGVLVDRFGRGCELMIGISLTGGAISTVLVPWFKTVQMIWFMIVMQGFFEGVINIAGQKMIINLWKEKAASPLHILHGGFGIGSFIIPLIANPFLAVPKPRSFAMVNKFTYPNNSFTFGDRPVVTAVVMEASTNHSSPMGNNVTGDNVVEYIKESRIEFAYLIPAIITVALSCVFYFYHFKERGMEDTDASRDPMVTTADNNRVKTVFKEALNMVNPATCAGGKFLYGAQILCLLFLYFINIVGGERILGKFIRAFAIEQRGFSVSGGSYLNTAFWLSFSFGRISGFVVARWIPIRKLILMETAGVLVTSVLMNIFAADYDVALWVLSCALGFFHAPGFPSGIGWGNYHIEMTGMAITFLLLGGSIGGIIYLRITGILFETYGARAFLYHVMAYGISSFTLTLIMTFVGARYGSRFKGEKKEQEKCKNATDTDTGEEMVTYKTRNQDI